MDNLLEEAAPRNGAVRFIKKLIKAIRAKQSFGLPVGGSAARLLAELALNDADRLLHSNGTTTTRFVDDFRMFLTDKPRDAVDFMSEHFEQLMIVAREAVTLMHILAVHYPNCFDGLTERVISAVLSSPATSIQLIRTWLLDLFVRGTVPLNGQQLRRLENNSNSLSDRRQLLLARGMSRDRNYFGRRKAEFSLLSPVEQPTFIWGASCLPRDEYET